MRSGGAYDANGTLTGLVPVVFFCKGGTVSWMNGGASRRVVVDGRTYTEQATSCEHESGGD